jgi:hypothetical protein
MSLVSSAYGVAVAHVHLRAFLDVDDERHREPGTAGPCHARMIPPRGRLVFTTPRAYSDGAMPTPTASAREPSLTERLGALLRRPIPEAAPERAALHVLDWIGCAIVGATTAPGMIVADWGRQQVSGRLGDVAELTARLP